MDRKPIFDAIRRLLGRGIRPAEVAAIDGAIDRALGVEPTAASDSAPAPRPARRIGPDGIALIQRFEGCAKKQPDGRYAAYPDPGTGAEPWTIGWGSTRDEAGERIAPGTIWTRAQCDAQLERDLARYAADVARAIGPAPTSQPQFDALVSFHYNTGAIGRATLTRLHVAGDHKGAAAEFARWNKAAGRVLKGLTRRREAEAALYRQG